MSRKVWADMGVSGSAATNGRPVVGALTRRAMSMGISPRNGTPRRSASRRAPPWPKIGSRRAGGRIGEEGHVLDDAQDRHRRGHLAEHRRRAAGVDEGDLLRRRDDHHAIDAELLDQGQVNVARPGRQVDHQHVERIDSRSPADVLDHLAHRRGGHRSAPDHRRRLIDDEADGHDLEAPGLEGLELAVLELRLLVDAQSSAAPKGRRCRRRAGPTARPRPAKAQARFTATVDLPTPPLPLATAITRATCASRSAGGMAGELASGSADPRAAFAHACRPRARRPSGAGGGQHHLGPVDARHGHEGALGGVAHRRVEGGVGSGDLEHEPGAALPHHQALDEAGRRQALRRSWDRRSGRGRARTASLSGEGRLAHRLLIALQLRASHIRTAGAALQAPRRRAGPKEARRRLKPFMPWNDNANPGPWGTPPSSDGPERRRTRRQPPAPPPRRPRRLRRPRGPDLRELWRRLRERIDGLTGAVRRRDMRRWITIGVPGGWSCSPGSSPASTIVQPNEEAVITRFGAYVALRGAGPALSPAGPDRDGASWSR